MPEVDLAFEGQLDQLQGEWAPGIDIAEGTTVVGTTGGHQEQDGMDFTGQSEDISLVIHSHQSRMP